uniref:Uncharacterized protein n=1 Tax=Meloidogyne hapla TaxID=6305 RepID=A0A1I8BU74_MELHA
MFIRTKNFIIKIFILLQISLNNKANSSISERQHEFHGLIKPNIYFYNGIEKPIVWKIEIKCLHGCDDWFRYYLQATLDNVDKAGVFVIKLMAGGKTDGIGYKKISQLRVHIRSMDLLAGQFRVGFL